MSKEQQIDGVITNKNFKSNNFEVKSNNEIEETAKVIEAVNYCKDEKAVSNMKLDEIIHALRCCSVRRNKEENCDNCFYSHRESDTGCVNELLEDTLNYLENHNPEQIFNELDIYMRDFSTGDIDLGAFLRVIDSIKEKCLGE